MNKVYKVVLINLVIAFIVTAICISTSGGYHTGSDTAIVFGLVCLGLGLLNLLTGVILLFTREKQLANGMLLSGAILLLLCGISCGGGLNGMRF